MLKKKQKKTAVKKHIFNVRIFRYLGPVIYTKSNQNFDFMQSVGLRLSLYEVRNNKKKKVPPLLAFGLLNATHKNRCLDKGSA